MATDLGICNRALSRIGIDEYLEDLDDPKPSAVSCKLHLAPCRQELLQDIEWPFARKMEALALVSDTVPGWKYVYRYPVDCLTVQKVALCETDPTVAYRILADTDDDHRLIATDLEKAYALYTYDVKDPNQMTANFRSALSWRIAAELALALRADAGRGQFAQNQYLRALEGAGAHSLNEQPALKSATPETVSIR